MKLRFLIKRAREIIKQEHDRVVDEFREDDGSITSENFADATLLKRTYAALLQDAERVLGPDRPRTRRKRKQPVRKIVVQR